MNSSLVTLRRGFTALVVIFVAAVIGFRVFADYDWLESVWMVVITISTVGYGEHSSVSATTKLLSIALILLGTTAAAYTFTGIIQLMLHGEFERAFGKRRMEKEINRLKNHTIICGYGKRGLILAEHFRSEDRPFVIIENDETEFQQAIQLGYPALNADATDEDVLRKAGIERAKAIVIGLPRDAENVFITLSARNLNPNIRIVSQADQKSSARKLRQAGADEVVMAHPMVAEYMARLVTRPSTAHFFQSLASAGDEDFLLDELRVTDASPVIDKSIAELRIRDLYELLVVGIKLADGKFVFNPAGGRSFNANETILVMGKPSAIRRFQSDNSLIESGAEE